MEHCISELRGTIANGTNDREACSKNWFAILVRVNTEKKVAHRLSMMGYECYLPIQTEAHKWSDRTRMIDRIIIPMVLFIYVNRKQISDISKYSFVHKFISYPGRTEPAIIPNDQIERLKFLLHNAISCVELTNSRFEIGDKIEITRGPLKGLYGELCYIKKDKPMIGIRIELFGYACVNINKSDVKIITNKN